MYCYKCGAQIPDDAAFCPKCGERISPFSDNKSNSAHDINDSDVSSEANNNQVLNNQQPKDDGAINREISATIKDGEAKNKKSIIFIIKRVVSCAAAIGLVVLLIMAFTGKFDEQAYRLGLGGIPDSLCGIASGKASSKEITYSDGSKSYVAFNKAGKALQDENGNYYTTGNTDLLQFLYMSEDDLVQLFDFVKNEEHIYPSVGTLENDLSDSCMMFWFENGKIFEVAVNNKTHAQYPNATVCGVWYGMDEKLAKETLTSKGYTQLGDGLETDGSVRVSYYNDENRTVTVEYSDGRVSFAGYSTEDNSALINDYLAITSMIEDADDNIYETEQSDTEQIDMTDVVVMSDGDYSMWSGPYYLENGQDFYLDVVISADSSGQSACGSITEYFRGNVTEGDVYHVGGAVFYWDSYDGWYIYPMEVSGQLKLKLVSSDESETLIYSLDQ